MIQPAHKMTIIHFISGVSLLFHKSHLAMSQYKSPADFILRCAKSVILNTHVMQTAQTRMNKRTLLASSAKSKYGGSIALPR